MTTLIADVETDNLLRKMTRVWCLTIANAEKPGRLETYADQPGYLPLAEGYARLKAADKIVFHNGLAFDLHVINKMAPGTVRFEQVIDTLVISRLLDPELKGGHSLEAWGVRLGYAKIVHNEWDRFSKQMVDRNRVDVVITTKLFAKLSSRPDTWDRAVALEHQVAYVISLQEQNGFQLNVEKAQLLEADLRQEKVDIERKLQAQFEPWWVPVKAKGSALVKPKRDNKKLGYTGPFVDGGYTTRIGGETVVIEGTGEEFQPVFTRVALEPFNPGSRSQIETRLRRLYGWKPSKFTNTGAAKLDETTLNEIAVEYPEARPMARYFRLDKMLGMLSDGKQAWLKLVENGRVHGSVNPNGAVTSRMSHYAPNLAQVDKKEPRMRECWESRPGWKLVGADASGLELRMLAHYLGRYDDCAYAREVVNGDVHGLTQSAVRELAGLDMTRDGVKTLTYATLYGAGDRKLGLIVIQDFLEQGKARPTGSPTAIGKRVRKAMMQGITGFGSLVNAVKRKHNEQKWIGGLDGRRIYTRSEHAALNTLLQGAGAVVMKQALAIFHFELLEFQDWHEARGHWAYCVNVHDEIQIEADPKYAEGLGKLFVRAIQQAGERLGVRCPLDGEFVVGSNWKETH